MPDVEIVLLDAANRHALDRLAPGVFDHALTPETAR